MGIETKDIACVFSVQHTGTWFTIKLLQHFIPNTMEADKVLLSETGIAQPTILHTHFPIFQEFDMSLGMDWQSRRQLTMKNRFMPIRAIKLLSRLFKVVIPLRDPTAAILTREVRHPDLRHFFIVDNFVDIAQQFDGHPNIIFLPVDLPWPIEKRIEKIKEVLAHFSLSTEESFISEFCKQWEPQNTTPGNFFKEMYLNRDFDGLKKALGPKWAELRHFSNYASVLFPFLEKHGYRREDICL